MQPNILTQLFSPPISETVDGAVDSSLSSVQDTSVEPLHLQAPLVQQFMNRVDVSTIHTEAQVTFDPPIRMSSSSN